MTFPEGFGALAWTLREVEISSCVHYCAFRYGLGEFNPYENFTRGIVSGRPAQALRADFIDFLVHYRPRNLADALGVDIPEDVHLWQFPWRRRLLGGRGAWRASPAEVPDILTHFSDAGVPSALIEQECHWLMRAVNTMRCDGYQPQRYTYARLIELRDGDRCSYLVLDGNHRIAALAALGKARVLAQVSRWRGVRAEQIRYWPQVRKGQVSPQSALAILRAYLDGNRRPFRSTAAAAVITT